MQYGNFTYYICVNFYFTNIKTVIHKDSIFSRIEILIKPDEKDGIFILLLYIIMNKNTEELVPGYFYHIYNRGIGKDKIFFKDDNYIYFLRKYNQYLYNYVETYSYCLIPNHFHLLVRVRDSIFLKDGISAPDISEQFRKFFISYSMSINKQEKRMGSLFIKNFKRKIILKDNYIRSVIFYIHYNPVHHNICKKIEEYKWSSYLPILSDKPSKLPRQKIFEWFGSKQGFIDFHNEIHIKKEFESFFIE